MPELAADGSTGRVPAGGAGAGDKTAGNTAVGEFVRLEVGEGAHAGVATIRLDRPPMNALNTQVQEELRAAATVAASRTDIGAVVVYGGPKVFAAGADIKEMADMGYADMAARGPALSSAFDTVARIPKPVIAAVTGYALGGGCELALACDLRFVAADAKLGQPEIRIGVIPGAGGTQRLPRLVGPSRAKDIVFTGRHVPADEALAIGLADRVVAPDEVYEVALDYAARFVGGPAQALRAAKTAIDGGLEVDLRSGLDLETQLFGALFATDDKNIGMRAFTEKRKPDFTGR